MLLDLEDPSKIVARAKWNRYEAENQDSKYWDNKGGQEYVDENGQLVKPGDYIDYEGNKVDFIGRVPEYDPETNRFVIVRQTWISTCLICGSFDIILGLPYAHIVILILNALIALGLVIFGCLVLKDFWCQRKKPEGVCTDMDWKRLLRV